MAIKFTKLQDSRLTLTDTIMTGKLAGSRICDVVNDYYEYLMWTETSGLLKYHQEVIVAIETQAILAGWEPYTPQPQSQSLSTLEDIPF